MTAINTTLKVADLKPGKALRLVITGHPIALIKAKNGELYALDDKCSHGEISLSEGFVDKETIECWAHGAKFSLATGEALTLPAFEPVGRYEVIVENDEIYIDYDAE